MTPNFPKRPRLKKSAIVQVLGDDTVFILEEDEFSALQGKIYVDLVSMLDGTRAVPQLMATVGSKYSFNDFFIALGHLAERGWLADGPTNNGYAAFYDIFNATHKADSPEHWRVSVTALGGSDPAPLVECLRSHALDIQDDSPLRVVMVDDYLNPELESINAAQHESGQPWLLTRPGGHVLWVGPLVRPGQSACWQCLAQRLRANREVERYVEQYADELPGQQVPASPSPGSHLAGASLATVEVIKALVAAESSSLENKLLTFDLASLECVEHTVIKRPQCATCGSIEFIEPAPIELQSRPKLHPVLSGHRSALPEQTFAKYKHHISPLTGVVTRMIPRQDKSGLVNNISAGHYFPLLRDDIAQMQANLHARSGAGGETVAAARAATLCECIERYSTIYFGDRKRIQATREELGDKAFDLRQLQLFSEAQYADRAALNSKVLSGRQFVSDPPSDNATYSWATAWSLTHQRLVHLPATFSFYGFQEADTRTACDSNGVAAGNSLEEAILAGLLELIERDAVSLWWYNRCRRPALDMTSFDVPYWNKTSRYYHDKLGRELHVLDLRVDTQIPVIAVVSRRVDSPVEDITFGCAAHLDPQVALMRALSSMNQYLPALEMRMPNGDTIYRYVDAETMAWFKNATYEGHPYLLPDPNVPARKSQDLQSMASDDIRDDLVRCIDILRELELEVLALDLTRPDIGLPVARVVVPGLRHFWRRLAPGRLYDVPVKLGWFDKPLTENEMNPVSCFV